MEEIKINMDNLSETEREQLMKLVEKANEPKSKVWKPVKGDRYYSYGNNLDKAICWTWYGDCTDEARFETGNCFATAEEGIELYKELKYRTMLKRMSVESGESENPWDGEKRHHFILYNALTDNFYFDSATQTREEKFYFTSE